MTTPAEFRTLARMLALVGADTARTLRAGLGEAEITTKSSISDLVTRADKDTERVILDGIRAARPDDSIIGEEGSNYEGTSGYRWLVDPIDGTTNYVYGFPCWSVSVGVEHETQGTIAGCVVDPIHGEVYSAAKGEGAEMNGRPIKVRNCTSLDAALVGTGFPYEREDRKRQGDACSLLLPQIRDLRRGGSAALETCWVAAGKLDAYFHRHLGPWDVSAAGIIASEAGAQIFPMSSPGGMFWACTPGVADQFSSALTAANA